MLPRIFVIFGTCVLCFQIENIIKRHRLYTVVSLEKEIKKNRTVIILRKTHICCCAVFSSRVERRFSCTTSSRAMTLRVLCAGVFTVNIIVTFFCKITFFQPFEKCPWVHVFKLHDRSEKKKNMLWFWAYDKNRYYLLIGGSGSLIFRRTCLIYWNFHPSRA